MKKSSLSAFIKEEIINTLSEDAGADKAAQDAKKVAIDKEIVALQKKKQELSKGAQSTLAEGNNPELEKKVLNFLKGIAKLYGYGMEDAFMAVEGTMKRLKGDLNLEETQDLNEKIGKKTPNFTIKGEYEGEPQEFGGKELLDILNDNIELSRGLEDFIKKVTYAITDETSNLSQEDKSKLENWYNIHRGEIVTELARIATTLKAGDADKIKAAKETYAGNWREKLIDAVVSAGEKGITQPDLAAALDKPSQQAINPTVNELIKMGVLTKVGADIAKAKPDTNPSGEPDVADDFDIKNPLGMEKSTAPSQKKKKVEKDEEEDVEIEDTYYKADDEFDAPEEEPKAKDIAKAEKVLGKATASHAGTLSPEDEARLDKLKKGINAKVAKLSKMKKADRLKSDEMKVLKALVGRDDVKKLFKQKGVSLKDLVSDVIAESTKVGINEGKNQKNVEFAKSLDNAYNLLLDLKKHYGE